MLTHRFGYAHGDIRLSSFFIKEWTQGTKRYNLVIKFGNLDSAMEEACGEEGRNYFGSVRYMSWGKFSPLYSVNHLQFDTNRTYYNRDAYNVTKKSSTNKKI